MVRLGGQSAVGKACDAVKRRAKKLLKKFGIVQDEHKTRRYLGGMRPDKYYDSVIWRDLGETLQILGFTYDSGFDVFSAFIDIDDDNSGEVGVSEFHKWLGFPATKFSERVFGILDMDGSGQLDFREFMIGVWNWNTYDATGITKLAFNTMDVRDRCLEAFLSPFDDVCSMTSRRWPRAPSTRRRRDACIARRPSLIDNNTGRPEGRHRLARGRRHVKDGLRVSEGRSFTVKTDRHQWGW